MKSRTLLFGGTFDPIHNAHLEIANAAASRLGLQPGVGKVLFIPTAKPPHKVAGPLASYEDRVRMVELACGGNPLFEVSRIEEESGDPHQKSYSIDTIEKLHHADSSLLFFLIGADAFAELTSWHRWQTIVRLVEFVVVTRPGFFYEIPPGAVIHQMAGLQTPVSSSAVRRSILTGDQSVPIPASVLQYIRQQQLYR